MRQTITHGALGLASSAGSVWLTLSNVDTALRITGSVVGIAVGVATFVSIVRKARK